MNIENIEWMQVGPTSDPGAFLRSTVTILGCPMHLDAWAVRDVSGLQEVDVLCDLDWEYRIYDDGLGELMELVGATGPWETVNISGRDYILHATPFCR